jgi:hypothetical protein
MTPDQQRRLTDQVEASSDHDLLIEVVTHLKSICKKQDETAKAVKDLSEKMDVKLEKKLDSPTFWKLVVVLTLVIGSLYTAVGVNLVTSRVNSTNIAHYNSEID